MADTNNSAAAPAPASAPQGHGNPRTPQQHAEPRRDIVTGINSASEFAASLAANYEITRYENNSLWPVFTHRLDATVCFTMFQNILKPLIYGNFRPMGAQGTTNQADTNMLDNIAATVAYEAMNSLYIVLFNKAARKSIANGTLFGTQPINLAKTYPSYITAIINQFGPVTFTDVPFRGTHIPYLRYSEVTPLRPGNYNANLYARFLDACTRSRTIAMADTMPNTIDSSPFWCFHARTITAEHFHNEYGIEIYSNTQFTQCDNSLKIAVAFARSKLTAGPGPINYSASPYYTVQRQTLASFPAPAKDYPYFIQSQPAYYTIIEEGAPTDIPGNPTLRPRSTRSTTPSSDHRPSSPEPRQMQAAEQSTANSSRRRKLPDGTVTIESDTLHRIVYHYFDHVAVRNVNIDYQLDQWAIELNRAQ